MAVSSIFFVFVLSSFFNCITTKTTSSHTQVDLIIQGLEDLEWGEDNTKCIQDTINILSNVKNHTLWAVWIWSSMTYPNGMFYGSRYSLGNYDQCLKAPSVTGDPKILTQYCLVDVRLTGGEVSKGRETNIYDTTDEFVKVKSKAGRNFNILTWGTCLPASCDHHAVTKILKVVYSVNPLALADPDITVDNCQLAGEQTVYSTSFYVFMTVIAVLVAAAISSTIFLQYTSEDTKLTRVAYSFSLQRNWSSFVKTTGDEIPFISFTKTIHTIMTTCSHCFVFLLMGAIGNGVDFDNYLLKKDYMLGNWMQHLDLPSVENFFIIGGLLVMKSLMEKKMHPITYLLKRYIRFIGSFTFLVFYTIAVSKYTGDGPLWNKLAGREQKACEENWVWSLLMLNNYVNNEAICQLVAWYVPCDYQLAIMGTILFILWKWNKIIGKVATFLAGLFALVVPGIVTYWRRLPAILMHEVDEFTHARINSVYVNTYIKSHHRAGPYFIGMVMGYFLTVYKPTKYRGIISRKWSYIGFIVAGLIGLKVWTSAAAWCLEEYDAWNSAIYAAFNRNIWALSTCIAIVIAEYGDIPKLQSIFAWPGFVICSRLAYGVYITHSLILQRNIFSQRQPMQFDLFTLSVTGLGVLLASSLFAVLLWLFVEAPLSNLTNLILAPRKHTIINRINNRDNTEASNETNEMKNGKDL